MHPEACRADTDEALRLGELIMEAGFPPGVVNILTGLGETTGAALVAQRGQDRLQGSTAVGKLINKSAQARVTELGGKSPVHGCRRQRRDRPPRAARSLRGLGLYAHRKIFDQVVEGISGAAKSIKLGPGLDPTQMGPLVSKEQQERVLGYIESGRKRAHP